MKIIFCDINFHKFETLNSNDEESEVFMNLLNRMAIAFMNGMSRLGAESTDLNIEQNFGWVKTLNNALRKILVPILAVVAAAGAIYAIVVAVQMAKADSGEKREEAKKRLIGLIVAVVVLVVLIIFFLWLLPLILKAVLGNYLTPDELSTFFD